MKGLEELGAQLRRIRRERGISLKEVSSRTGITNSRLSKLERGLLAEPSLAMLSKLSFLYSVSLSDMADWAGYYSGSEYRKNPWIKNLENLSETERKSIQSVVDCLAGRKEHGI